MRQSIQPPQPPFEFVRGHPEILVYFDPDNNDDVYVQMERLAKYLSDIKLYREASIYFAWLTKQALSEKRKIQRVEDLKYVCNHWAASNDFLEDIKDNLVTAIITDNPAFIGDNVNIRQDPVLGKNVLGKLEFNEECQVLERSDTRQRINGTDAYWYKVRTTDDTEGWVYGQLLSFYLDLPPQT